MVCRNDVFQKIDDESRWRVLDETPCKMHLIVICMTATKPLPISVPRELLEDTKVFVQPELPEHVSKPKISAAAAKRRDAAYEAIKPLVSDPALYNPKKRSPLVLARAKELGMSPQTLYTLLRRWWCNGLTPHALTPQFHKIGISPGKIGVRGRRAKNGKPPYPLKAKDFENFDKALKCYLKNKLTTLEAAYDELIGKDYSFIDGEGELINLPPGECPSKGQFIYYARKKLPRETIIRSKQGNVEFELKHRAVLDSLRHSTYTVGDIYEIDATLADSFLVHAADRAKLIGKPSLYLIVDRKSGLVVGFYIGLEEASWVAAMQAILSISTDKRELCEHYGVPYDPADWPAHCIMPKEFYGDRGPEMIGHESTKIAAALELIFTNLPARRADWKPVVECGIKQIQRPMRGLLPGYSPPEDFGKRQKDDYASDAALTLHAFTQFILKVIIKHNKTPIKNYPMSAEDILSGMQPTPINIWNKEIRTRAGLLTRYSKEELQLELLPQLDASVHREGIRVGDRYYSAPEAMERGWFVAAGHRSFSVKASFDLRLVDTILIHDPESPDGYFEAQLLGKSEMYRGLSHQEAEALALKRAELRRQGEVDARQLRTQFNHDVTEMIAAEKALTKAACKGKSRSSRRQDTKVARQEAQRQERQDFGGAAGPKPREAPAATVIALPAVRPVSPASTALTSPPQKTRQQKYEELLNGH